MREKKTSKISAGRAENAVQKADKSSSTKAGKAGKAGKAVVRRRFKAQQLSGVASDLLSRTYRQKGFVHDRVVRDWVSIVGPELGAITAPLKTQFPRGSRSGASLFIRCTSSFAPLLTHRAPEVIDAVNRYFGYAAVTQIRVQQGPLPKGRARLAARPVKALSAEDKKHIDDLIPDDEGSDLRKSLKSLAGAILRQR